MVVKKKTTAAKVVKAKRKPVPSLKKKASVKVSTRKTPVKKSTVSKSTSATPSVKKWFTKPNSPTFTKTPVPRKKVAATHVLQHVARHSPQPIDHKHVNRSFHEHYHIHQHYGETTLAILARDPNWLYAYWEIGQKSIDQLRREMGDEFHHSTYVLRIYDVTFVDFNGSNANRHFDIDVGRHAQNWYINLWNDNSNYCADLGARSRDGRFWPIVRSNFVQTPRSYPSYRSDVIWLEVEENKRSDSFIYVTFRKRGSNNGYSKKRRFYLSEEELRAFFARYFQILKQIIWQRWRSQMPESDDIEIEGVDFYLDDLLEGEEVDGITQKMFTGSSEEWQKLLKRRRKRRGGEDLLHPGASENTSSGSWQLQQANVERKFFFEIGTELIVYGRTEPDATVTLGGKPVALRPDGTFSMRFALHDGNVPLDFKATSVNKIDKRQISTSVVRTKTKYKSDF